VDYFVLCGLRKTNPIKANVFVLSSVCCGKRTAKGDLKKQSQFARAEYRVLYIAKMNLKKQSQYVLARISATSYMKRGYGNILV